MIRRSELCTMGKQQLACPECGKYLHSVAKKGDSFQNTEEFASYYDRVYTHPVDSVEFADHVGRDYSAEQEKGAINLTTAVFECPQCFGQSIRETVQIFNGRQWNDVGELTRWVAIPKGVDVRPIFGSHYSV